MCSSDLIKIHMIGIKGTGMSALAELLCARGARVSGSDVADVFYTDRILARLGVPVRTPFSCQNLADAPDVVIHSAAYVPEENDELAEAYRRGIPTLTYPEALGDISCARFSCGIAGVHGKTTTTAMIAQMVKELRLDASVLVGSAVSGNNDSCVVLNGDTFFIAETCEYRRHFLHFHPQKIVLTSVEHDHQDYYSSYEDILAAYFHYIDRLPQFGELFYCVDDQGVREVVQLAFFSRPDLVYVPYGERAWGDYGVSIHGVQDRKISFSLRGFAGEFYVALPGEHSVLNATGALALALSLVKKQYGEVTVEHLTALRKVLALFQGCRRRSEVLGEVRGILFMDDYGHHPTAIKKTLRGLKTFFPERRIVVDFMSHTYSRTAALLTEFAESFQDADVVILHEIYASAREVYQGEVNGEHLFELTKRKHRRVYYYEAVMQAVPFLQAELKEGDLFVTLGAGDNCKLGEVLFNYFKEEV